MTRHLLYIGLLLTGLTAVFVWSAIAPRDLFTWFLEAAPVIIALPLLVFTYHRFRLTGLLYGLIFLHAVVLLVGAHYTYAEVPLFNALQQAFGLERNHYDRVGHLAQGFFPAIVVREILLRRSPLKVGQWLFFLVVCVCLAFSAFYEMVEWWVALSSGSNATAFLGTQGDVWDTQWDMFLALSGAIASQLLLSGSHDRQLRVLVGKSRS